MHRAESSKLSFGRVDDPAFTPYLPLRGLGGPLRQPSWHARANHSRGPFGDTTRGVAQILANLSGKSISIDDNDMF